MTVSDHTILDYIDDIVVPGAVFKSPANEYWALVCLRDGMEFLYRQAKHCDNAINAKFNTHGEVKHLAYGNLPELQGVPKGLLTCSFHWYAISACNYVRTIGTIACQRDSKYPKSIVYIKKVIPQVLAFRNKVAAHFAWASKNNKDTDADRVVSILPPLVFINDSFHVGGLSVALKKAGKTSKSEAVEAWSICKVHEQLQKRYWPSALDKAS